MELILASGSARRRELLENCGYEFTVIRPDADEGSVAAANPEELVRALAARKAEAVWSSLPEERRREAVVLGSDTVVVIDGNIIGKPRSEEEAFAMLKKESGKVNTVHTGVAVRTVYGTAVSSDSARVRFAELTDEETAAYIKTGEPMDKAGAYGIQGVFSMFVEAVEGSYFTVMGLPVHVVYRMLKEAGILPGMLKKNE